MASDGELFTRAYAERGQPVQDSARFRVRLVAYIQDTDAIELHSLATYIRRELGVEVVGNHPGVRAFFVGFPIEDILNAITVVIRMLEDKASRDRYGGLSNHYTQHANRWLKFVERVFREENLGYTVNRSGGVRYFVDEEFERNRISALSALGAQPLSAVRDAFESAHRYLDPGSRDTKASVRSTFEAIEILARLIYPDQAKLSRNLVLQKLRPDLAAAAPDKVAADAIDPAVKGFGDIIDGAHEYRHGQGVEEPVAPPIDYAVFLLSTVASMLRWMVPVWNAKQS